MRVKVLYSRTGRSAQLLSKLVRVELLGQTLPQTVDPTDIVVSLGYMKRIPESIWSKCLTVNVHPGILPVFAGRHPQLRALADLKRSYTAVILHSIDSDEYDVGPGLSTTLVDITERDRDDPNAFFERTRLIGVYMVAAFLIGKGANAV